MTRLTDDQKYGMIEAITHLIHRDYGAIVKDSVKLDFIHEGVNLEPILSVLAKVFDQALEGCGTKNINFQELAADLAQITFDYLSYVHILYNKCCFSFPPKGPTVIACIIALNIRGKMCSSVLHP